MYQNLIVLLAFMLLLGQCRDSFYINYYQTTAYYKCFKEQGYDHITLYIQPYFPDSIEECIQNMMNAKNAGLGLGVLFIFYREMTPEEQVQILAKNMGLDAIDKIWVYPDLNQDWSTHSPESNCIYLQKAIKILKQTFGATVGVLTGKDQWQRMFKSQTYCPELSDYPLWWFPSDQQQNYQPNFDNYQQIGGWQVPYMKDYYFSKQVCSYKEVYVSYYV